jgi:two-component system, sporulation sensor kinase B
VSRLSEIIKELLLNVFFVIFPLFVYQMFWIDKKRNYPKWDRVVIFLFPLSSILLCMSFPITFSSSFHFDLRQIPFILGCLYGGYPLGFGLLIGISSYPFLLYGQGVYINFLVICLICLVVPLLKSKFSSSSLRKKTMTTVGISILSASSTMIFAYLFIDIPHLFSAQFIGVQAFGMWLITYLVETLRTNIRLKDEIIKAEKINVISQLAASISHEVRNPLTSTKGLIQLMNQYDFPEEKKKEFLKIAMDELDQAQKIITDFLSMAKTKQDKTDILNVAEELRYVIDVLCPYAKMNAVEIHTDFIGKNYWIDGEKQKLHQCFINLIKNCIESITDKGTVHVKLSNLQDQVLIDIRDTGCGMTLDEVQRLGTPYYSTKDNGTGLGMMIVFNIIKSINGQLDIESKKGKGTRFFIKLPLALTKPLDS